MLMQLKINDFLVTANCHHIFGYITEKRVRPVDCGTLSIRSEYNWKFLTVQFQNRTMKMVSMRLPPLPRKDSLKKIRIDSQQAPRIFKGDFFKNTEAAQTSAEDIPEPLQDCDKSANLKRPTSKKSQESYKSIRVRDVSGSVKNTKKTTSLQHNSFSDIPPKVTAKSWVLYEMRQGRSLYARRGRKRREMASLTKMMNLVTILQLLEKNSISAKLIKIKASTIACSIEGTTAELQTNCEYTLQDLLYGMMLPSGNDAAFLIAEVGGYLIQQGCSSNWESMSSTIENKQGAFAGIFLREMNSIAQRLGMYGSNFANPHGLNNPQNFSCAEDLARLCAYAMKNHQFRKIVQTRKYEYKPIRQNSTNMKQKGEGYENQGEERGTWENTNRMLGVGWSGIKTGITPNAGPCLAASLHKVMNGRQYQFLVILLGSESMEARWSQVTSLVEWAIMTRLYI